MDVPEECARRREFSTQRLADVRSGVADIELLDDYPDLCIYVTGSFGRLEGSEHSDLDLFFVHTGSKETDAVPHIDKTLLDADLIRLARDLGFPEFSGDAEYLEIHYLDDILENLGSPRDDYFNYFTARLLLLLESQPIYNDSVYRHVRQAVIESYFRDFHDHASDFLPTFLVNDIIRFWKTLCLNYEHRRNRPPEQAERRNANHLKNLKLKFSRLLTCYSMICAVSAETVPVTATEILEFADAPPLGRVLSLSDHSSEPIAFIQKILTEYSWFLEMTSTTKSEQLAWISNRDSRDDAFERARRFGRAMYEFLTSVVQEDELLRFIVI